MEDKKYTVKEIAGLEQVSESLVYDWVKLGYLQAERTPSKKQQGRISITQKAYRDFGYIFSFYTLLLFFCLAHLLVCKLASVKKIYA